VHFAVVHLQGSSVVVVPRAEEETASEVEVDLKNPGPIVPEIDELIWGAGSFIVFALLMRFFLFPRLKRGMDARYQGIRDDHEQADAERAAARAEVAEYEAQLAGIKGEAARVIDGARQTVEAERTAAIGELNVRIAERRAVAAAEAEAARAAARGQIEAAVTDVAGRAGELATGRRPEPDVVSRVVQEVMAR
jgi:F-type H+-transporting ATPase subunit b